MDMVAGVSFDFPSYMVAMRLMHVEGNHGRDVVMWLLVRRAVVYLDV